MSTYTDASLIVTPNSYKAGKLYSLKPTDGTGDLDVVRATTATRVNADGLIESVAINEPRLDYSNGCPSILVEPQRTNLILQSTTLSNAVLSEITLTSGILSPEGINNAFSLLETSSNSEHYYYSPSTSFTNQTVTSSIFVKANGRTKVRVSNNLNMINQYAYVDYDLIDNSIIKTVSSNVIYQNSTIQDYANGWKRITITSSKPTSTYSYRLGIWPLDDLGSVSYEGDITKGIYIYGPQQEVNASNATSYIPTAGSAVTRNLDNFTLLNLQSKDIVSSNQGVFFYDITSKEKPTALRVISNIYNINTNDVRLIVDSNNLIFSLPNIGSFTIGVNNIDSRYKIAFVYTNNNTYIFVNGVKSTVLGAMPNFPNNFELRGNSAFELNNFIAYKTALTDEQCISLTTL